MRRRLLLDAAGRHADILIALSLTLLAAVLRLWDLGAIPQGVHGDEAQVGMDARRVLSEGWIGPYTLSALGQPAGHAYLTAPSIELFGSTAWAVRLPLALTGIAAVPLAYILFCLLSTRVVATIAAFLLATSLWHLHFSRVAHWPISYGTVALAVLILWTLALRSGRWYWFVAAGAVLGLGVYTYNVYPVFVFAFSLWVLAYTLLFKRGPELTQWVQNVSLAAVTALIFALPLFLYMVDADNHYFDHYRGYYEQYSVLASDHFEAAGFTDKVEIVFEQAKRFLGAYVWHGITDYVDASSPDERPMLDPLTVWVFVGGAVYAARHWRETPHLLALILVAIIPLSTVMQTNAIYRGPLGVAPFLSFLAALPLGLAWSHAGQVRTDLQPFLRAGVVIVLVVIAGRNVYTYFGPWADSYWFPWVYTQQISAASEYINDLPQRPYVYFYSQRWSFNYETRQFLAPEVQGEDRSREFGRQQGFVIDRSRESVLMLLPPYDAAISEVQRLYPDGHVLIQRDGNETLFIAYHLPTLTGASADPVLPGDSGASLPR
jgi:4-amino-4-deoxy-L-arabinose transferase-like glycosyltransferase